MNQMLFETSIPLKISADLNSRLQSTKQLNWFNNPLSSWLLQPLNPLFCVMFYFDAYNLPHTVLKIADSRDIKNINTGNQFLVQYKAIPEYRLNSLVTIITWNRAENLIIKVKAFHCQHRLLSLAQDGWFLLWFFSSELKNPIPFTCWVSNGFG